MGVPIRCLIPYLDSNCASCDLCRSISRFLLHDRPAALKIGYNDASDFEAKHMRLVFQFLAILTIAALLAPGVQWASLRGPVEACTCPPAACMCPGHHHAFGHPPTCSMANGGQCGVVSHDSYLSSLLSALIYVPTEHHWWNPVVPWSFGLNTLTSSLLPSYARIPEQPPRLIL